MARVSRVRLALWDRICSNDNVILICYGGQILTSVLLLTRVVEDIVSTWKEVLSVIVRLGTESVVTADVKVGRYFLLREKRLFSDVLTSHTHSAVLNCVVFQSLSL